jgi:hypothetical protein
MPETNLNTLKRWSRFLSWFAVAIVAVMLAAGGYITVFGFRDATFFADAFPGVPIEPTTVSYAARIAIVALVWFFIAVAIHALLALRRMFDLFAQGRVMDREAAGHLRRAGIALVVLTIMKTLMRTVAILLLTLGNPEGQRQLAIGLDSDQLFAFLLAGILLVVGHALVLGADIADENRSFV